MARKSLTNNTLASVVGQETYDVWVKMLQSLVPNGRTHRLAPLIAGMLQYAFDVANERYGDHPEECSVAQALLHAAESNEPEEAGEHLSGLIARLFKDAEVRYERVNSQGDDYNIADSTLYEFVHWYDMPWEA